MLHGTIMRGVLVLLLFQVLLFEAHARIPDPPLSDLLSSEDSIETELNTTSATTSTDLQRSNNQSVTLPENKYTFYPEAKSWIEALLTCWEDGKELAVPRSSQEAEMLTDLMFQHADNVDAHAEMTDAVHIGIHFHVRNQWFTVAGQRVSQTGYNKWLDGGLGSCGALFVDGSFLKVMCKTELAFICQTVEKNSFVDHNYTSIGGVGYFRLHTTPLPWSKAQKQCEAEGGSLAVPTSERVAGLMAGALLSRVSFSGRPAGCFIGASDVVQEGKWEVASGLTLQQSGYESWRPNQPSGNRSENCAILMEDGLYDDYPCVSPLSFCCEIPEYNTGTSKTVFNYGGYQLHVDRVNWWEAVFSCHKQNMILASPRTLDADSLRSFIRNAKLEGLDFSDKIHIGFHNINRMKIRKNLRGDRIPNTTRDSYYFGNSNRHLNEFENIYANEDEDRYSNEDEDRYSNEDEDRYSNEDEDRYSNEDEDRYSNEHEDRYRISSGNGGKSATCGRMDLRSLSFSDCSDFLSYVCTSHY